MKVIRIVCIYMRVRDSLLYVCMQTSYLCMHACYRSSRLSVLKDFGQTMTGTRDVVRDKELVFHAGNVVVVYHSFSVNLVQSDY
jgi:hypothetical protein